MAAACNAQTISSEPWARRLAGQVLHFVWRAVTLRPASGASESPDNFARALRAGLCAKGQACDLSFYVRCAPRRWIYGTTNLDLRALYDKDLPDSVRGNAGLDGMTAGQARFPIAPSHWGFTRRGKSGRWVSDLLPWTGRLVDELALVQSLQTDAINHEPAILLMNTGNMVPGKPSMGAWLSYGLGSMNENLPTFVVLNSLTLPGTDLQPISPKLWSSGFLSNEYAGVAFRSTRGASAISWRSKGHESRNAAHADRHCECNQPNERWKKLVIRRPTRAFNQYEMAFRMQTSLPELTDMGDEPDSTWTLYGDEARQPGTFAYNCLLARRMAERGVRFTQIYQRGWDVHSNAVPNLPKLCAATDRASYALVTDLRRRGLLDDTLVLWGGEFGRTVYSQGGLSKENYGRDHHPRCFTMWMAGGGGKRGIVHGETDDFCYNVVKDPGACARLQCNRASIAGHRSPKADVQVSGSGTKIDGSRSGENRAGTTVMKSSSRRSFLPARQWLLRP